MVALKNNKGGRFGRLCCLISRPQNSRPPDSLNPVHPSDISKDKLKLPEWSKRTLGFGPLDFKVYW